MALELKHFFDRATFTLTYVLFDPTSKDAIVIDSVWDYDPASSKTGTESIDRVLDFVKEQDLRLHWVLETHAHADHLTGAAEIRRRIPGVKIGIGKKISEVQGVFKDVFNMKDFNTDGVQFDVLLEEGKKYQVGTIEIEAIFTPGHTPACSSYLMEDRVFVGDALFMPDFGTGRCDFPGGSSADLYHSIHEKLYKLPEETRVYTGHDYQPQGRELKYESTIGEQKAHNIQLKEETTQEEFVKFRTERDAVLEAPRLLLPSIQVNIDAGHLPQAEENGVSYLRIPVGRSK